jgi:hypothetical protein
MMLGTCRKMAGLLLGALVLAAAPAIAQAPASSPEKWTFTASPYVWFSGLSGDVSNPSGGEDFSADFGDIFGSMKFSWMGLLEARRGRFSALVDTLYLNMQQGVPVPGRGGFSGASARTQSAQAAAIALYTVAEERAWRLEFGGGVRAWWFDTELKLDSDILPGRTVGNTTSWVDPVLSTRGVVRLSDRWALTGYGDIGGFGVGSELTWQVFATLDWRITDNFSASAGFRWIHIEYEEGRSTINLDMAGPIIGASLRF